LHQYVHQDPTFHFVFKLSFKFLASTVLEIWMGPKVIKVGHVTPSRPLWPNFAFFFVRTPSGQSACKIWSF